MMSAALPPPFGEIITSPFPALVPRVKLVFGSAPALERSIVWPALYAFCNDPPPQPLQEDTVNAALPKFTVVAFEVSVPLAGLSAMLPLAPEAIVNAPESVSVFAVKVSVPITVLLANVPTPALVILVVAPKTTSPLLLILNFVTPDVLALKISLEEAPVWLIIRPAFPPVL